MANRQICTFSVAGMDLGVDVAHVLEVLLGLEMTHVPLAPEAVSGLINLRGRIVTALDLRSRLELPPRETGETPMNVIVQSGDSVLSLLVDSIGDVEDITDDCLEAPPDTLDPVTRGIVSSVCKLDGRLLLLVEPKAIVDGCDTRQGQEPVAC